jgi:SagB-type dehydrogenase family enzyme
MHVALEQSSLRDAAAVILIAAVYERTTAKYSARGMRYVHMEVGHAAQNVYLQAVALDLRTVAIEAFDAEVKRVAHRSEHEQPLYLLLEGNNHRGALDKGSNRNTDSTEGKHANVRLASSTA